MTMNRELAVALGNTIVTEGQRMACVNFYAADRTMSNRVAEFMRCKLWKKELQLVYGKKIDAMKQSIQNLDNLKGSIHEDKIPEMRTTLMAQIAEFEAERDEQIKLEATFELTEADKALKKALKKADGASDLVAEAVAKWFDCYGLNIRNTYFLDEILEHFGSKFDFKKFCATYGMDARALDVTRSLEMMYATAYTHMVGKTIKQAQIPSLIWEKYAPKKGNKKAKASK